MTFQDIINTLQDYWVKNGDCVQLQSYDLEVGAGTLSPHTALRVLDDRPWNVCYVQYSRRPTDARFASNPNRLGGYYQLQVILKPSPENVQELCVKSLEKIGIDLQQHDIRFVEDDWKNDSIGAAGRGFEIWCDGMEIVQFTYMQRMGGIECPVVSCEITYGLERVAMYVQNKDSIFDIDWHKTASGEMIKYADVHFREYEIEQSGYFQQYIEDSEYNKQHFSSLLKNIDGLISQKMVLPAYEQCLKASHYLNILDARKLLSHNERTAAILLVRDAVNKCCSTWLEKQKNYFKK